MAVTKLASRNGSRGPSEGGRVGDLDVLLGDGQRLVKFARGTVGHHVHVVRVDAGGDAEAGQVAGQRVDVGGRLAVPGGELADRQEVRARYAPLDLGLERADLLLFEA